VGTPVVAFRSVADTLVATPHSVADTLVATPHSVVGTLAVASHLVVGTPVAALRSVVDPLAATPHSVVGTLAVASHLVAGTPVAALRSVVDPSAAVAFVKRYPTCLDSSEIALAAQFLALAVGDHNDCKRAHRLAVPGDNIDKTWLLLQISYLHNECDTLHYPVLSSNLGVNTTPGTAKRAERHPSP
jgi:hypothetical protein